MFSRKFMSVKEVSELLQVGETTIRNWIRSCELPAIDVGREWRVAPVELEAFLKTRKPQATGIAAKRITF
ncbi:MAG: helix-turn-helix domain-containing protein [Pseudomonadota bacterium]